MVHCPNAVKATVNYSIGSKKVKYISELVPIDVVVKQEQPTFNGGQCPMLYNVTYRIKLGGNGEGAIATTTLLGAIHRGVTLGTFPEDEGYNQYTGGGLYGYYEYSLRIYHADTSNYLGGGSGSFANQPGRIPLRKDHYVEVLSATPVNPNQLDNCDTREKICSIKILHNNQVIYTDRGQCPINYAVSCDDECPPGTTKCIKSDYPGYCCLPCADTKAKIRAITSQIRSLNNG